MTVSQPWFTPAAIPTIYSASADLLIVAAAGNDNCSTDSNGNKPVPASYVGVLAVSALSNVNDALAGFSNHGSYVDLTAPGVSISIDHFRHRPFDR